MKPEQKEYKRIPLIIHPLYGRLYLAPPSWDCDWYWGWGYLQNKDTHIHADSVLKYPDFKECLVDELKGIHFDLLELLKDFYTVTKYAELCKRGGSHIKYIDDVKEILKNTEEYERLNMEVIPQLFEKFYTLIDKHLEQQNNKDNE